MYAAMVMEWAIANSVKVKAAVARDRRRSIDSGMIDAARGYTFPVDTLSLHRRDRASSASKQLWIVVQVPM